MAKDLTRRRWTKEEDDTIIKSFKQDWSWEELYKALKPRTTNAVVRRADQLKKQGKVKQTLARWTTDEDKTVISGMQANLTPEQIQQELPSRTVAAISARATVIRKADRMPGEARKTSRKPRQSTSARLRDGTEPFATGEGMEIRGNNNDQVLTLRSKTIKDPYDALKEANVDTDVWEIKDFLVNKWDMGAKRKDQESLMVIELWQVKVWLKRKDIHPFKTALEGILEDIHKHAPKYPKFGKPTGKHMLEVSLFDSHFGKLAWAPETGEDYDLKIAKRLYGNAVSDLLSKSSSFGIDHILFPIGQDFFHIDNSTNMTPRGHNLLDVDGRLPKIFDAGCRSVVEAIDMCLQTAPVEIIWVPGNHDKETSMYLCKFLSAWYRNTPRVTVDESPKFRKYKLYGVNLIGFTHGDMEKHAALPTIMAGEEPEKWAQAQFREWHLGHFHKKKETSYSVGDAHVGVQVKVLPSLCGTDAWHYGMGYVKGRRSAEAYLWNKEDGYAAHLSSNIPNPS